MNVLPDNGRPSNNVRTLNIDAARNSQDGCAGTGRRNIMITLAPE
ncbi:hypothetical protein [Microtetraspora sp. NBRC 16547]|nr:hypothetical protein [Microtetraspora sp. NBRC 16547]